MNTDHNIYELTDAQRHLLGLKPEPLDADARAEYEKLKADTARLDGYLKGRADSDLPKLKLGAGDGTARGAGSNGDLAG